MKLYFVTVPTLVDFYQSQNALAAEGSRAKAQLETQAAIAKQGNEAEAAIAEKRLQQEQTLERYKQQMENLRTARTTSSAEQQFLQEELGRNMRANLGQETEVEKTEITQQGAMEREIAKMEANAPRLEAQTRAANELATSREQARPLMQAKMEAETRLAIEKQRIAASPDLQGIMTEVKQFKDQEKQLKSTLGKEGYNKMLGILQQRSMSLGVDLNTNQDYLEATSEARKESVVKVTESLKTFGDDAVMQGSITTFMYNLQRLQDATASGSYSSSDLSAARAKLASFARAKNLPTEYTELV